MSSVTSSALRAPSFLISAAAAILAIELPTLAATVA
jgi:hypothetical protein